MEEFVRAYESGNVEALVSLLTDDVHVSMPPIPLEYRGRDVVARFYASLTRGSWKYDLVPTRANGQVAFGAYVHSDSSAKRHGAGLLVLTLSGRRINAIARYAVTWTLTLSA